MNYRPDTPKASVIGCQWHWYPRSDVPYFPPDDGVRFVRENVAPRARRRDLLRKRRAAAEPQHPRHGMTLASAPPAPSTTSRWIYDFADGGREQRALLGAKGDVSCLPCRMLVARVASAQAAVRAARSAPDE